MNLTEEQKKELRGINRAISTGKSDPNFGDTWKTVRTEDALRIAREAFEAGKREGRAEVLQPIIKKMGDLTAKFYAQGAETAARGTAALVRKLESLAKEPGE